MITTKVSAEITTYKEKFFLGLSLRQLACFAVGVVVAILTALLGTKLFHMDINLLGYIIMAEVTPICALGFLQPKGMPFERWFAMFFCWKFGKQKIGIAANSQTPFSRKCETLSEHPFVLSKKMKKMRAKAIKAESKQAMREFDALKKGKKIDAQIS